MSGIDEYTRFHWSFDSSEDAWLSQAYFDGSQWLAYNYDTGAYDLPNNYDDYPHVESGQYDSKKGRFATGKFGVGLYVYSATQTTSPSYQFLTGAMNPYAPPGLSALINGDFTIDFWIKVIGSGFQPILYHQGTGYQITYSDGMLLVSINGNTRKWSCACDLTGSFHHVEINRSDGLNRIFIDGVWQEPVLDGWIPLESYIDPYGWCLGNKWYNLQNIEYVIDEIRISNVARHVVDFAVPTESYTRVFPPTTIASPDDATIVFDSNIELSYELEGKAITLAVDDLNILLKQPITLELQLLEDETVPAIQDGRIRFELLFELVPGFYGLTVPAIQDGEIVFELSISYEVDLQGNLIQVTPLINQVYQVEALPATLTAELAVDVILYRVIPGYILYSIEFINALELGWQLILLNALEHPITGSIEFVNRSTIPITFSLTVSNNVLEKNEVSKTLNLYNRLLGSTVIQNYAGFYFSKIHGA